jgi:hypothetical protein
MATSGYSYGGYQATNDLMPDYSKDCTRASTQANERSGVNFVPH